MNHFLDRIYMITLIFLSIFSLRVRLKNHNPPIGGKVHSHKLPKWHFLQSLTSPSQVLSGAEKKEKSSWIL